MTSWWLDDDEDENCRCETETNNSNWILDKIRMYYTEMWGIKEYNERNQMEKLKSSTRNVEAQKAKNKFSLVDLTIGFNLGCKCVIIYRGHFELYVFMQPLCHEQNVTQG